MVAVTGRARCLMDTGRFPPGGFRPSVNPAEPEALYPHIIREIRARIEPALDDGRFARKERCYARAVAHLDTIAVDDDPDGARAA